VQLVEQIQKVRRHCLDVDLAAEHFSRVDEYSGTLEHAVKEQVRELVEKKSKEAQAEIARLKEVLQFDEREREARIRQAWQQLTQWDNVGEYAKQVVDQIEALKRPREPVKAVSKRPGR
jgi:predicted house-cleaning noncanonical NTP pyrophosphatase (MazG superfamily)